MNKEPGAKHYGPPNMINTGFNLSGNKSGGGSKK